MAKPAIHAASSALKFGGAAEDYYDIHEFLDSSKGVMPDNRHRALTHNAWFLRFILPLKFGYDRVNSAGRAYSVIDVGEQHVKEDFGGFIPSAQDFLQEMELKPWMNNGPGKPTSATRLKIPGKHDSPAPPPETAPHRSSHQMIKPHG